MKYDVFISYRREGGYDTAKHINDLLVRDWYRVSFDIDTLRNGDFDTQLLGRIEECKDFILIVDQHAFDRTLDPDFDPKKDWLRCELAHAIKHNKNIIPVFLSGVSGLPEGLPEDILPVTKKNGPEYNKYYFNDFYKQLRFRFIKSYSLKTKLAVIATTLLSLIVLAVTLGIAYSNEEEMYIDPLVPRTTTEAEFVEFSRKKLQEKTDTNNPMQCDSISQSKKWYNLAQQGDYEAQLYLGLSYCTGYGGEQDYKKAIKWLRKATNGGNAVAQYALAVCYDNALGVKEDWKIATELYHKAAEQGLVEAQCDYAIACVWKNKDRSEASKWLNLAAEQYYARAMYALGWFAGQNSREFEDAMYWMEMAAFDYEYPMAGSALANIYLSNIASFRDEELGILLLKDLCKNDDAVALYYLACCYAQGNGVEPDYEKAFELLKRSVAKNHAPALTEMGTIYLSGSIAFDITQDLSKAMEFFLEAADQGYPPAQYYISQMYYNGLGVKKSKYKGNKWLNKAYKQGYNPQLIQQQQQQQHMKYLEKQ